MLNGARATSSVIGTQTASTVQLRSTPIARAATLRARRLKPQPGGTDQERLGHGVGMLPVATEGIAEGADAAAHGAGQAAEQAEGNDAVGAQGDEPDEDHSDGEGGDHDHHAGTEQGPQQDGRGDPPAGHPEHACEAAACKRGEHAAVADLPAHLDGAHGVATHTRREHLREEQALQVGGAQPAPAEQGTRCRTGWSVGGAQQHSPFHDACSHGEHGESEGGGNPERIGVCQARDRLRQIDRAGQDDQADHRPTDPDPWGSDHPAGGLQGLSHRHH